ncbi:hypothetical protein Cgig2_027465 [Carnegiea gigantea]|uniref:Uncharacterized protein n=1 Tax=Carnegiea gigantea TaxID=171969 RepID=A0A9Q1QKZ5_9CARY|nr:hypothetical protein Cgig2_027465 [Carnegiea gigantea]
MISGDYQERRLYKRSILLLMKPSYTLKKGSKRIHHEHHVKLRGLLCKLVRQQSWVQASGVLSVLLKGTCKERSLQKNRFKYWVAMELIRHLETDAAAYRKGIERLYSIWMRKLHSWKNRPLKDKSAKLESILSVLTHYTTRVPSVVPPLVGVSGGQEVLRLLPNELTMSRRRSNAREDARSLLLAVESASDPLSNLVIGLTFYEDWYSTIPREMQLKNVVVETSMLIDLETVGYKGASAASRGNINVPVVDQQIHDHADLLWWDRNSHFPNFPNFSCAPATAYVLVRAVLSILGSSHSLLWQDPNSSAVDLHSSLSICHCNRLALPGLWQLLPLRCSSSEDMERLFSSRRLFDDTYKNALKHLLLAFRSAPPVTEAALLPLIQVLLLGDQIEEALVVLGDACNDSNSMLPFRLRAHISEWFYADDLDIIPVYVEDVLKKNPACRYSLAKLISLHQKGGYAAERLVEMIGLHLEATYPGHNIWWEFASCLLKLSWCEEDGASMCMDGDEVARKQRDVRISRIPIMFKGKSGKTWKLRCKWWLNRHFSKNILASEISAGDLKLIAYKAACACHLYGKASEYFAKVNTYLEGHDDKTLLTFLNMHTRSSIGFYSKFIRK